MPRVGVRRAVLVPGSDGEWREPVPRLLERQFSQSLERGLSILECFSPGRPVLGIADLADELGMTRSTTHRYVLTLTALGYLVQGARRKYQLGLRVTDLGMSTMNSTGLREHARPHLEDLGRRSGYTVAIGELDGPELVYVDWVRGTRRGTHLVDRGFAEGSRVPLHRTAMGKLLLANLARQVQTEVISELGLSNKSKTTRALRAELKCIHEDGLAVNDHEFAPELCAIAVPLRCESREVVAAVGMVAHRSTILLEDLVGHLAPHLVSTADRISARLGYRRDDEQAGGR